MSWGAIAAREVIGLPNTVGGLMTAPAPVIDADVDVEAARSLLEATGRWHLAVERDGHLAGVVSLRDLVARGRSGVAVGAVMTSPAVVALPGEPVVEAGRRMQRLRIGSLPVTNGARLVGMVELPDFVRLALRVLELEASERGPQVTVSRLMTPAPLIAARVDDDVLETLDRMRRMACHHMPVVEQERLVGMVSDIDLRAALADAETASASVREAMRPPAATRAEADAINAGRTLLRRRREAMPVCRGRRLVGMLSMRDYLAWVLL